MKGEKMLKGWRYYNHAMMPTTAPHEKVDKEAILNGSVWHPDNGKKPLFVRWTEDFDCGYETEFWYCICEHKPDLSKLKAKRRYEITKALKLLTCELVNPLDYEDELYRLTTESYLDYPKAYRPSVTREAFHRWMKEWVEAGYFVYLAKAKADGECMGYCTCLSHGSYVTLVNAKVPHKYEKNNVNAILVYTSCMELLDEPKYGFKYMNDGARNIMHSTNYQSYLVKYHGFRFAYCSLHIEYSLLMKIAIKAGMIFKPILEKVKHLNKKIYIYIAILNQEDIRRSFLNK